MPSPGAGADRFIPGFEVVDPFRHEDWERAGDDEVVELAVCVVDDPVPFLFVDHLAVVLVEDAGGARVDHEQPRVAEVAVVRPARVRRFAVPVTGGLAQTRPGVRVGSDEREELLFGELRR